MTFLYIYESRICHVQRNEPNSAKKKICKKNQINPVNETVIYLHNQDEMETKYLKLWRRTTMKPWRKVR